jgi:protein LSM14
LEHVVSHGTEGRRNNAAEEIAASDNVYDYIVFRGKDVKDLKIQEPTQENKPPEPPQVPDDPAILGVSVSPFVIPVEMFELAVLALNELR